jgi:hypothetical protein
VNPRIAVVAAIVLAAVGGQYVGRKIGLEYGYRAGTRHVSEDLQKAYDKGWADGSINANRIWHVMNYEQPIPPAPMASYDPDAAIADAMRYETDRRRARDDREAEDRAAAQRHRENVAWRDFLFR